jgi:hypothetical protein
MLIGFLLILILSLIFSIVSPENWSYLQLTFILYTSVRSLLLSSLGVLLIPNSL